MKNTVIKINDILFMLLILALVLIGALFGSANGTFSAVLFGIGGLVLGSMLSGAWFVLSGIYAELRLMNARAKQ